MQTRLVTARSRPGISGLRFHLQRRASRIGSTWPGQASQRFRVRPTEVDDSQSVPGMRDPGARSEKITKENVYSTAYLPSASASEDSWKEEVEVDLPVYCLPRASRIGLTWVYDRIRQM